MDCAKTTSISYFCQSDSSNDSPNLFSNKDMLGKDLKVEDGSSNSFNHHHLSSGIPIKKQVDGCNCGLHYLWFIMWYQLNHNRKFPELDLPRFCMQLMLCITGLMIYFDYISDESFQFSTDYSIIHLMCRDRLDYSNSIFRSIFKRNKLSLSSWHPSESSKKNKSRPPSQNLQLLEFQQTFDIKMWAEKVEKVGKGPRSNCFYYCSLSSLLFGDKKFPLSLLELSQFHGVDIEVYVHWNFKRKPIQEVFHREMPNTFIQNEVGKEGI